MRIRLTKGNNLELSCSMSTRPGGQARRSTRPLNAPETLIGRVLDGRFRLDRVLSAGGMGIVFEAKQLTIQRVVAVKLLFNFGVCTHITCVSVFSAVVQLYRYIFDIAHSQSDADSNSYNVRCNSGDAECSASYTDRLIDG